MTLQIYWTILLIFFTVFMVYYNTTKQLMLDTSQVTIIKEPIRVVKKVVAYSLNKQIELEGQEYLCGKKFRNIELPSIKYLSGFWNKVDNTELYVTSVTLDNRLEPYHYLRIVGVIEGNRNDTIYCQIVTSDGNVRIIKSTVTPIWYEKWNTNDNHTYFNPALVSCRLPALEDRINPIAASLALNPCNLSTYFYKIIKPMDTTKHFTVCVKPLNFKTDISIHLVQWFEICRILGAQYFHLFLHSVTKNTKQILEWYSRRFPNTFYIEDYQPVETECQNCSTQSYFQKTWQRRRYEVVTYNKCFNTNINSKFIIPLDIDELIVPKTVSSWKDLIDKYDDNNYSSFIVQNVYFFRRHQARYNRPFFLSENRRIKLPSKKGENSKSFISTKNTLTVFNHYALHSLRPGVMKDYFLPFRDVQLSHYKESCNHVIFPECTKYLSSSSVIDNVITKYKNNFNKRYNSVLHRLKADKII